MDKPAEILKLEKAYNIQLKELPFDDYDPLFFSLYTNHFVRQPNANTVFALNLSEKQISNLIPLVHLTSLSSLVLRVGKIADLKPLEHLTTLTSLELSKCQITDLKPLEHLTSLTSLNLSVNKISDITPLNRLTSLNSLDLRENEITDLKPLEHLTSLTSLNLSANKISDLKLLEHLSTLTSLDLSENQITDLKPLEHLTSLTSLNLSVNKISDLKHLKNLSSLTSLDLSENQITDLKPFEEMTSITILDFSSNQIFDLKSLENLTSLNTLFLDSNQIYDLKPLQYLTSLNTLELSNNQISDLQPLKHLISLTDLHISSNQISDLNPLQHLTSIINLDLRSNQISDLKPIKHLNSITMIDLGENQISDLKPFGHLTSMTSLYLSSNLISDLKPLENLTSITTLFLSSNQIYDLKPLEHLTSLTSLMLRANQISDLKPLIHLTTLISLDLSSNQISDLKPIEYLTSLTSLELNSNQITDLKPLELLTSLTSLEVSYNQISNLKSLKDLTSLTSLYLRFNLITDIKPIKHLTSLTLLDLSYNQISGLKPLENLTSLTSLYLEYNENLKEIDLYFENHENHLSQVKNYFYLIKQKETKTTVKLPLKIILLGNHASGKSTFMDFFNHQEDLVENKDDSTHVLRVETFSIDENETLPSAMFYDFGGQDYYHGIYQTFLTTEAFTLLFWHHGTNHNKYDHDKNKIPITNYQLKYWLGQYIYFKKGETEKNIDDLWSIQTYADKDNNDLNYFEYVKKKFYLSLKANFNDEANKATLKYLKSILKLKIAARKEEEITQVELDLYKEIYKKSKTVDQESINLHELTEAYIKDTKIDIDVLKGQLEKMAQSGLILYKNINGIDNKVWLNPTALAQYVHKNILKIENIRKGQVAKSTFEGFFTDKSLLKLLLSQKVVFLDPHSNQYIIPNYLPLLKEDGEDYFIFQDFHQPDLVLKFKNFIPFGYINRLICNFGNNPDKKTFRRNQLVFTLDQKVKIMINLDFEKLNVEVAFRPKPNVVLPPFFIRGFLYELMGMYSDYSISESKKRELGSYEFQKAVIAFEKMPDKVKEIILNNRFNISSSYNENYNSVILPKDLDIIINSKDLFDYETIKKMGHLHKYMISEDQLKIFSEYEYDDRHFKIPSDLYISLNGKDFVHLNTLEDVEKTSNLINVHQLTEKGDIDESKMVTVQTTPFKKISFNKNLISMKKIFVSYSRQDVYYKDELRKHLEFARTFGVVDHWACEDIKLGLWHDQIQKELEGADIVIMMMSINFFTSRYIIEQEVLKTMQNIESGKGVKIYPITVSEFPSIDLLHKNGEGNELNDAIKRVADHQFGMYDKEDKSHGEKTERIYSLREFKERNKLDWALAKIVEKIIKDSQ